METVSRHQCMIYDGPPSQKLPLVALIIQKKLDEGYRCLYMNSAPMVAGMRSCLAALNIDVVYEIAEARLVLSSEPVASLQKEFDVDEMLARLEDALDQALEDGYKGLFATGDMTWEFGPGKNFEKLLEYESRLELMFRKRKELSGICQYHRDTLPHNVMKQGLQMHPAVFISETLSVLNPHYTTSRLSATQMAMNPKLDDMLEAICCGRVL